jgi:hypothetical protein
MDINEEQDWKQQFSSVSAEFGIFISVNDEQISI